MYLMWYDNNRKKQTQTKIDEAIERYVEKFGHKPTVVLVNPAESVEGVALHVVPRPSIALNQYWLGDGVPASSQLAGAA